MLSIEEYKKKYPQAFCWGSFTDKPIYSGLRYIREGLLQFREENACCWGGPLEGNYAQFVLSDYTNAVFTAGSNKGQKVLEVWHQKDLEVQNKIDRGHYEIVQRTPRLNKLELPHLEKPIKLYICGNDDTSYSKFYATEQEALEELELFIAAEPLDFFELIDGFKFIFTN